MHRRSPLLLLLSRSPAPIVDPPRGDTPRPPAIFGSDPVDPSRPRTYTPQDGDPGFYAVWDHWLLDTLSSWQRQAEGSYSIEMDDERAPSPLSRQQQEEGRLAAEAGVPSAEPAMLDGEKPEPDDGDEGGDGMPPRKRPRAELGVIPNQLVSV